MKVNEHTALQTGTILLVPYSKHHVPTYHEWMQDPDLQEATASEPLSLDEEYAMQQSWRNDHDKLTFIICQPLDAGSSSTETGAAVLAAAKIDDAPNRMVGDINLFLFPPDSEDMETDVAALSGSVIGEVELMIARKDMRQRGYGRAALLAFLDYILSNWSLISREYAQAGTSNTSRTTGALASAPRLAHLRVKINQDNVGSIRLFDSAGFVRTADGPNYFGELEMRWLPDATALRKQKEWEKVRELPFLNAEAGKLSQSSEK